MSRSSRDERALRWLRSEPTVALRMTTIAVANVSGKSPVRAGTNEKAISRLVESGPPFLPVLVSTDGELIDGWLRLEAARRLGLTTLSAAVIQVHNRVEVLTGLRPSPTSCT